MTFPDNEYSLFEAIWHKYIADTSPMIAYGFITFVLHMVVFWTVNLPFILLQFGFVPHSIAQWAAKYRVNDKVSLLLFVQQQS